MTDNSTNTKRKAPAFQFYADDFLAGTITMTNEERGAYISLLCIQWSRGFLLENDFQRVCAGMPPHSVGICQSKFEVDSEAHYRNRRLESERVKQKEYSQKQRENAISRWKKDAVAMPTHMPDDANALPEGMPKLCSPSPSPSPKNKSKDDHGSPWSVRFGIEMPESLRTQPCMAAIRLWLDYKTEKREGYKRIGLQAALTKWSKDFTADTFPSAVDTSIASGWSGIFPPKVQAQSPTKPDDKWRPDMDIANYM
jgi:uncharacterized protein YdaU (DUF1376 family)